MRALIIAATVLALGSVPAQAQQGHQPQITDIPAIGLQGWKYCSIMVDDVETSIVRMDRTERAEDYGTREKYCGGAKRQKMYHKLKAAGAPVTTKPKQEASNRRRDQTGSIASSRTRCC